VKAWNIEYSSRVSYKDITLLDAEINSGKWNRVLDCLPNNRKGKAIMTPEAIKLARKVKKELDIDLFPSVNRTYSGYWQRSAGAFVWWMYDEYLHSLGGTDTIKNLLNKKNKLWIVGDEIGCDRVKEDK
jgi:hypothetical protein